MVILATSVPKIVSDIMREIGEFCLLSLIYSSEAEHVKLRFVHHVIVTKVFAIHESGIFKLLI
jgi:hypothetical protein